MKKILFPILLNCCFICCSDSIRECKFEDGSLAALEDYRNDSLIFETIYYKNGNIHYKLYHFQNDKLLQNDFKAYYPDGFPLANCKMKNGIGTTPKEIGKTSGYDINIDFGPYTTLDNGKLVRPFRTFVDGVDIDEYFVIFHDTCDIDTLAKKFPPKLKEYVFICEDDTDTVSVNESLYAYYIDDLQKISLIDSAGRNYFFMDFYYKSALTPRYPNDSRVIIMHDSLNWEVREYDVKYVEE